MPSTHNQEMLTQVIALTAPGAQERHSLAELTEASVNVQTSLREAQADSPTINSDACVVLLTGEIGLRCNVYNFEQSAMSYEECANHVRQWLTDTSGRATRARAAEAAQAGACNLTPIVRGLHKAVEQVIQEGGEPEKDPAVRLIAHQMTWLTQTYDWSPDHEQANRMRAMAQAQLARTTVDQANQPSIAQKLG